VRGWRKVRIYTHSRGWSETDVFAEMPPVWMIRELPPQPRMMEYAFSSFPDIAQTYGRKIALERYARHVHPLWNPLNLGHGWLDVVYIEPD
jgi:hypothetical protein